MHRHAAFLSQSETFRLMLLMRFEHQHDVGLIEMIHHMSGHFAQMDGLFEAAPVHRIGKDPQGFSPVVGPHRRGDRAQDGNLVGHGRRRERCRPNFDLAVFIAQPQLRADGQTS